MPYFLQNCVFCFHYSTKHFRLIFWLHHKDKTPVHPCVSVWVSESISVFPSVSLFCLCLSLWPLSLPDVICTCASCCVSPPSGGSILAVLDAEPITQRCDRKHIRILAQWLSSTNTHTYAYTHTQNVSLFFFPRLSFERPTF